MHLTAAVITVVLLSTTQAFPSFGKSLSSPNPEKLVVRTGTLGIAYENAIPVRFDATGWENVANDMAYAMLCPDPPAPDVMQRLEEEDKTERKHKKQKHYRGSGAAARPAKPEGIKKYNLRAPKIDKNAEKWETMEEVPGESANILNENSRRPILIPSPLTEQRVQGRKMTEGLEHYGVKNGQWYQIVGFDNCHLAYCLAFNNNKDRSVCHEKLKGNEIDPDEFAAIRVSNPGQPYAFKNIGMKSWPGPSKRGLVDEGQTDVERRNSLIERADPDEEYPESEIVLDDLPAVDHD